MCKDLEKKLEAIKDEFAQLKEQHTKLVDKKKLVDQSLSKVLTRYQ